MQRCSRPSPRGRRDFLGGLLVLLLLLTIVGSATSGGLRQAPVDYYGTLVDVHEFAGTGYGGETSHSVRLDFNVASPTGGGGSTNGTTGSTTATSAGTTGSTATTTGGTTGMTPMDLSSARAYRVKPRHWMMRRNHTPQAGEGFLANLTPSDMIDVPAVMPTGPVTPTSSGGTGTSAGTTGTSAGTTGTSAGTTGSSAGTTGSSAGTTSSGGGSSGLTTTSEGTGFGVESAYASALTVNGAHPGGDFGYGVFGYSTSRGNHFEYRLPGAATRTVYYLYTRSGRKWHTDAAGNYYDDGPWSATTISGVTLALTRRDTPSVSIDSRRVYGQPNLDGEVPADPNADLRNPSFVGWAYRGGMFVGHAIGSDQSGTARIQAYVPSGTFTYPVASSYTLLALGSPPGHAPPTYGAFVPLIDPSSPPTGPSTVTWANRWDLSQATAVGDGDGLTPVPSGEYSRCFFPGDASNLIIALKDESNVGVWQYFSNSAYEAMPGATFPVSDSRPRTWTVDRTNVVTTYYQSGLP